MLSSSASRKPPTRARSRVDVHRLFLRVVLDGVAAKLPPDARLIISAERQFGRTVHESVDPDRAGAHAAAHGDGRVEIEDTRDAGGTAVGVATDEGACLEVDGKKRGWLTRAGADYIVPNFLDAGLLDIVAGVL